MNDKKLITDTVEATKSILPKTLLKIDDGLSTIIGFFSDVILYPLKKLNASFGQKIELFNEELLKKAQKITAPIKEADISIVGPSLEELKYRIDQDTIRDMYENLIISTIDTSKSDYVHPAFIDFIRQMNKNDAILLNEFRGDSVLPAISLKLVENKSDSYNYSIEYFNPTLWQHFKRKDEYLSALNNLIRLQIIETPPMVRLSDESIYESVKNHDYIVNYISSNPADENHSYKHEELLIRLTPLGIRFIKTCIC